MAFLIDTHVLLWAALVPKRLSARVHGILLDTPDDAIVSAVSPWEIAIKVRQGKLRLPEPVDTMLARRRVPTLDITVAHGIAAGSLPLHHTDPFDRMLVAQAQLENLTLVSSDVRLRAYDVPLLTASPSTSGSSE